ncbi:MAG: phenylalanine--tRNA ligase subunit beta [Acholeplasma sp.]|nr:phenylalanine--tRNA ligase subunit beta [Acholeplasma sp.]
MKILENGLKKFLDNIPNNVYELTNGYITEVESYGKLYDISNVVIGKVLEKNKHENADTLSVTKVDLGDRIEQIVCGAPNVDKGQYVIVAKEGAILPGDFVIKKSKIRGVESNGMICSLRELGIEDKNVPEQFKNGIYYFSEAKDLGTNALEHLAMDGFVLELSLTPNRGDLLSHYGYSQDLAAVLGTKIELPKLAINENNLENPLKVKIESIYTNSYYARYFENIEVKESPWWLKSFLIGMDCHPINNVVDITNYILYLYGIPMHAFDAKKFNSKQIVVKDNKKAQTVITLDGEERKLENDEIVITNGNEVMALGGVMGLENSMIDNDSKQIILEVASFNSDSIRKTSKKLDLKSDSSLRFERGIDENIMMHALNHATYLLETLANAKTSKGIASAIVKKNENPTIEISVKEINRKIGNRLTKKAIIGLLEKLNYEVVEVNNDLSVKAPSYRHDIKINDDVLEEIVRLYGMNNVKNAPLKLSGIGGLSNKQKRIRLLRHLLANIGFNEVVTYSLLKESSVKKYNDLGEIINVLRPLTNDRKSLRQSLLNGMVDVFNYNRDRSIDDVNIFEIGHVYAEGIENNYLAILSNKKSNTNPWKKELGAVDLYYLKGVLDNIMSSLKIEYELVSSENPSFHPYQQAVILVNQEKVGIIGRINPRIIDKNVFGLEIDLDRLEKTTYFKYTPVSKYPNVERDLAVVLKEDILINDVLKMINQTLKKHLVKLEVFDIYKGNHIEQGYQSVAFKMVFNDHEKTLESVDVDKMVGKVIRRLEFEFQGKIRN